MDLLPEIWQLLVPYLTLKHLNKFRLVSHDFCEYTKDHEGDPDEVATPYSLKLCFQCYPKLKRINTEYCFVGCEDFKSFKRLEELSIKTEYIVRDKLFAPCIKLKTLHISSNYFHQYTNLDFIKDLPQLTHLSMTNVTNIKDEAFDFSNQLESLELLGRCRITSLGINQLKHLKYLHIDTHHIGQSSMIRDHAFEGLPIEELVVHYHDFITDHGICHLKQLRKVVCVQVPQVQGEGWDALKKLETIGFGSTSLNQVSNFKMAKNLFFHECRILGSWKGLWTKLDQLRVHNTTFEYPESIKNILSPRLRKIRIIRCRQMMDYEESLCKTFGPKLSIRL